MSLPKGDVPSGLPGSAPAELVRLTIDGVEVDVPKGELVIRVAEQLGIAIPRFCDHPLLAPAGACRQCLVEIEGQRKPVTSCTQPVAEGMVVKTQLTSEVARKAQAGMMELLLINHPLDCPVCDKGGECPLQNQAMSSGRADSRFVEHKRKYPKPIPISTQILLDRERCVLCQRCTRFTDQIAGDRFIDLMERSAAEQIGIYTGDLEDPVDAAGLAGSAAPETPASTGAAPFNSYFSGNTIQICPVGALTGTQYRFRARPFDLVSSPDVCEHCAAGCAQRADHRRGEVLRRLAGDDVDVNEEWNCDKGRWAFQYATAADRIRQPLVRDTPGADLRPASWPEALAMAAAGLAAARDRGSADDHAGDARADGEASGVGVLTGGRLTVEDAYAYAKFARLALHTNDIDFRARPLSGHSGSAACHAASRPEMAAAEEADFLAASVVGTAGPTYADVERAPAIVVVALEPEEECPILFLRLRKAYREHSTRMLAVAPLVSRGLEKIGATVVLTPPGGEPRILREFAAIREACGEPGAILFVGERLATVPGGLSAAARLAAETGARLAWVPRRAGDRGAVEAGCLPNLLPGGRPVGDLTARAEIAQAWDLDAGVLRGEPGRDADAIISAARGGRLGALLVAGVDPEDLADPAAVEEALDNVGFVVSLELRDSAVTRRADVVLPVAPAVEKRGAYLNWEGRVRPFEAVLASPAMSDARVLDALARELGVELGCGDIGALRQELAALVGLPLADSASGVVVERTRAPRPSAPQVSIEEPATPPRGSAFLATWHHLLDLGRMQDGDGHLAGTARTPVVRISKGTAADLHAAARSANAGPSGTPGETAGTGDGDIAGTGDGDIAGIGDGDLVTVRSERGAITLPVAITDMLDGVVWLPTNSPGSRVPRMLGVTNGACVQISAGGAE